MIRHCVFIRFRPAVTPAEKAEIYRGIAALGERVAGMRTVHHGPNVSPETGMDKGFAEGFIIDFDHAAARDAYLVDDEHRRLGALIVAAAAGGVEGVLVFDLEVSGA
ncbi:Dabb family protein [Rhizobium sp. YIM 134829]|uniref:Dabb family protein n=1 Tax=Rhizobium sp. YIM 134829 TaxID=3390453 RepID=UPI00397CA9BA